MKRSGSLIAVAMLLILSGCAAQPTAEEDAATTVKARALVDRALKNLEASTVPSVAVSSECDDAMSNAASIDSSQTNDGALVQALYKCTSADEWTLAMVRHPAALGPDYITREEAATALRMTCANAMDAANDLEVCKGNL